MTGESIWAAAHALVWVDWAMLGVLLLSTGMGLWRGFVFELMALLGWVVAYVVARGYAPEVAPQLPVGSAGSALNTAAAFALVFFAALFAWGLLARLLRMLLRATPLGGVDRLGGAVFGLLRGMIVLLVLCTVVAMTPAANSKDWQASLGAQRLAQVLEGVKQTWPAEWGQRLRKQVGI